MLTGVSRHWRLSHAQIVTRCVIGAARGHQTRLKRCLLLLQRRLAQSLTQVPDDLLDQSRMRSWKNKQVFRASSGSWWNHEVFGQKFWLVRHDWVFQIDRPQEWASAFSRCEWDFVRLFVCGDQRAEKIRRNAPATAADARRSPRDRAPQKILRAENGFESDRQCLR